ncbi:MAG TPA: hypothetical protein DEF88_15020 [Porphyromonadaceae bacterium]|nr:hypothetical protein [Porphyromonadaceae bacterium]
MCLLLGFWLPLLFSSCSENVDPVLPAGGNTAFVNLVNAGEAFLFGDRDTLYRDNGAYINDSVTNLPLDSYMEEKKLWYLVDFLYDSGGRPEIRDYPRYLTHIASGHQSGTANADVFWLPIYPGGYDFIFTSKDKTYLKTEHIRLEAKSHNIVYLVESIETESSYAIINVPIERKERIEGKVTVQFVNLSPDAGKMEAYRVDAGGNETVETLPSNLDFGQYASTELSMEGAASTYDKLLLRFRPAGGGGDLASISVPAESGAVYTVLLRGFANEASRRIKKDNENYAEVTIQPNLRVSLRRGFY